MKVILVNGSPNEKGCTSAGLKEVEKSLNENNVETEIFWIGNKAIAGCLGCKACVKTNRCFMDDKVNEFLEKAEKVDGFVFGSPVHFASITGTVSCFMDRVFYKRKNIFSYKPAASIVSARRAGTTAALDNINKYFMISNMPVISSCYWNMIHGNNVEEVVKDEEGMQVMRTLGNNMAWILKCIEAGKRSNVNIPKQEEPVQTNFIR